MELTISRPSGNPHNLRTGQPENHNNLVLALLLALSEGTLRNYEKLIRFFACMKSNYKTINLQNLP